MAVRANHKRDSGGAATPARKQFESFSASELYCPRCRTARPVRERLLLVTPQGEIHDYRCVACGDSLGTREVASRQQGVIRR